MPMGTRVSYPPTAPAARSARIARAAFAPPGPWSAAAYAALEASINRTPADVAFDVDWACPNVIHSRARAGPSVCSKQSDCWVNPVDHVSCDSGTGDGCARNCHLRAVRADCDSDTDSDTDLKRSLQSWGDLAICVGIGIGIAIAIGFSSPR
jgi:hypothetical protein